MIRLSKFKVLLMILSMAILSGCAEKVQERQGQSIEVVPVEYITSFEAKNIAQTKAEVFGLIDDNFSLFAEKGAQFFWHTQQGKHLADQAVEYMVNKGISSNLVSLKQTNSPDKRLFDLSVRYKEYKTITQVCTYESIDRFGYGETGCYAENARWQSMVNPEKMLNSVR